MLRRKKTRKSRGPKRPWALLAYIAGDNNLSDAGLEDIQEMCDEGASERAHVGVEIDTRGDHTGSIRYEISEKDWEGRAHRVVIERLPEKDSGDPRTLTSFLEWGLSRFHADDYLVVIWNHGSGFRTIRRDIGFDDFGTSLDMPEIESAFRRAGISETRPISLLGFDACLMNMLEIAHHFRGQVKYLVGSQQTEPGDGWPYNQVLKAVKGAASAGALARAIVSVYIRDYKVRGIEDVTQSAIDLEKTEPAVAALSRLGAALAAGLSSWAPAMQQIRMTSQVYQMADYVDLIQLAAQIRDTITDRGLSAAAREVIQTTRSCILFSRTYGSTVKNSNGLSVWFPADAMTYTNYRGKYLDLKCAKQFPGWVKFLDAYHTGARLNVAAGDPRAISPSSA